MSSPLIVRGASTITITAEQARDTRARALKFVLDRHAKKKAAPTSRPDDTERSKNACANKEYTG